MPDQPKTRHLAPRNARHQAPNILAIIMIPTDDDRQRHLPRANRHRFLSSVAKKVVNDLSVLPKDFDESSYQRAIKGGLTEEEFVEIVGIVARIVDLDVFARGIGVPLKPLPEAQSGEPSRERPETATQEQAWVPTVPNLPEGGEIAKALYGEMPKPYIVRGLSLVPDEMKKHIELEQAQYMPLKHVRDFDYQHHDGLTRVQVEVVAGRVSAINQCFY